MGKGVQRFVVEIRIKTNTTRDVKWGKYRIEYAYAKPNYQDICRYVNKVNDNNSNNKKEMSTYLETNCRLKLYFYKWTENVACQFGKYW